MYTSNQNIHVSFLAYLSRATNRGLHLKCYLSKKCYKKKNNLVNISFDMNFKFRDCRSLRKPNQFQLAYKYTRTSISKYSYFNRTANDWNDNLTRFY